DADAVAGDGDPLAVDVEVAVVHELTSLGPGGGEAGPVHDVVEATLEHLEHELAGDALAAVRVLVEVAELALGQAVGEAGLLLLLQLGEVLGGLAPATAAAVLAGRVGAAVE